MNAVTVTKIDTRPESDPYHRDTNGVSRTVLRLDEVGNVDVYQDWDDNSTTEDCWNGRTLEWSIPGHPIGMILDEEIVGLLQRVHDGHIIDWDGSNNVGTLNDDADAASNAISRLLDDDWLSTNEEYDWPE